MIRVLDGPAVGDTQLHLLLTNKGRLTGDMVINLAVVAMK